MIDSFLKTQLNLSNYSIVKHKTWKDNITHEVILHDRKSFIIQELSHKKTQINKTFIQSVISYTEKNIPEVNFWGNYFDQRFYSCEWIDFQIMQRIPWKSIDEQDIDKHIIQETAYYLWKFHRWIIDFPNASQYKKINNFKDVFYFKEKAWEYVSPSNKNEIKNIFQNMCSLLWKKREDPSLPIWVIHWDPAFKNFLINDNKEITGLVDYDMMSVETFLWDLADMIRSYLKIKTFDKNSFHLLLKSYNQSRTLTPEEQIALQDYCVMMTLNTGFRYIISYFENTNLLWGKDDCLKKAQRCVNEVTKLNSFFL